MDFMVNNAKWKFPIIPLPRSYVFTQHMDQKHAQRFVASKNALFSSILDPKNCEMMQKLSMEIV